MKIRNLLSLTILMLLSSILFSAPKKTFAYYGSWLNSSGSRTIGLVTGNNSRTQYFPIDSAGVLGLDYIIYFYNGTVDSRSPYWRLLGNSGFHVSDSATYPTDSLSFEDGANGGWNGTNSHSMDSLIAKAHRMGIKVLAPIQAVAPPASTAMLYTILPDSIKTHTFVKNVVAWCTRKKFDGVDYNLENWNQEVLPANLAELNGRFFRLLRQEFNRVYSPVIPTITTACLWNPSWFNASCDANIDFYLLENSAWTSAWNGNIQANGIWFQMAYAKGTTPAGIDNTSAVSYNLTSPTSGIAAWLARRPANKTVLEFWGGGHTFRGGSQILGSFQYSAETSLRYMRMYQIGNGTVSRYFDSERMHAYATGVLATATPNIWWGAPGQNAGESVWISYVDSNAVKLWMHFIDSVGLAGGWVYDAGYDFDQFYPIGRGRNQIIEATIRAAKGTGDLTFPPSGTFTATPNTLPVGGGSVLLSWSSSTATSATLSIQPNNVTVTGTRTISVTSNQSFTITFTNAAGSTQYGVDIVVAQPFTELPIYRNAVLELPWSTDGSWSSVINPNSITSPYFGTSSINVQASAWGAIAFRNGTWSNSQDLNVTGIDSLQFALKGNGSSVDLILYLFDVNNVPIGSTSIIASPANTWIRKSVSFNLINPNRLPLRSIVIQSNQSISIDYNLDEVKFVGASSPPPIVQVYDTVSVSDKKYVSQSSKDTTIFFSVDVIKDRLLGIGRDTVYVNSLPYVIDRNILKNTISVPVRIQK